MRHPFPVLFIFSAAMTSTNSLPLHNTSSNFGPISGLRLYGDCKYLINALPSDPAGLALPAAFTHDSSCPDHVLPQIGSYGSCIVSVDLIIGSTIDYSDWREVKKALYQLNQLMYNHGSLIQQRLTGRYHAIELVLASSALTSNISRSTSPESSASVAF